MDDEMATSAVVSLANDEQQSQAPRDDPALSEALCAADLGGVGTADEASNQDGATTTVGQPDAAVTDGFASDLAALRKEVAGLRRDFQSKLLYDDGKQRQLDTLHQELEMYRRGFHFQMLRPVFTDLMTLYGDVEKVCARLAQREEAAEAARELAHVRDQIEETLRRNGVERFTTSGEEFDAKRQRVVAFVETADPSQDKRVAEHLRPGFEYEGRIVTQPEQVSAYRFVATPTEKAD